MRPYPSPFYYDPFWGPGWGPGWGPYGYGPWGDPFWYRPRTIIVPRPVPHPPPRGK